MAAASDNTRTSSTHGPVTHAIRSNEREHDPDRKLRLVADNPALESEDWRDIPRHTLLSFTLPRRDIDGAYSGVKSLLWANARMMAAIDAMKAGNEAEARSNIDRAIVEMTSANAFAEKFYAMVKRKARRTNRREVRS